MTVIKCFTNVNIKIQKASLISAQQDQETSKGCGVHYSRKWGERNKKGKIATQLGVVG